MRYSYTMLPQELCTQLSKSQIEELTEKINEIFIQKEQNTLQLNDSLKVESKPDVERPLEKENFNTW